MTDTLANGEAKTLGDKRPIWRPRLLLLNTVSETLAVAEIETARHMGNVGARPQVDTLPYTVPEANAETLTQTLGDVKAEALVETGSHTLAKAEGETINESRAMWRPSNWSAHWLIR